MRICEFPECSRVHVAKGFCSPHYRQLVLYGLNSLRPIGSYQKGAHVQTRDSEGRKKCTSCREWLAEEDFNTRSKSPDGLTARCKACSRRASLWKFYRLTLERFNEILDSQGGGCAICRRVQVRGWHVDHDHACCPEGRTCGLCVRGILCSNCNTGIGMLQENEETLESALSYLRAWRA